MDLDILKKLSTLGRLGADPGELRPCKCCGAPTRFFDVVDFNKCCNVEDPYLFGPSGVPVEYFRCIRCGFVATPFFDDWTGEDFARFVYNQDYVRVDPDYLGRRPEADAERLAQLLDGAEDPRILDYGSGSGLLADRLRDRGFTRASSYDPFSQPDLVETAFDIITCFEVLEHTPAPRETIQALARLLAPGGCILFSTGVQPRDIEQIRANWWYVAPRNGHISIHTLRSLRLIGDEQGLRLHAGGGGLAYAQAEVSRTTAKILAALGPAILQFQLAAPIGEGLLPGEEAQCWHGLEASPQGRFRWTMAERIAWRLQGDPLEACEVRLVVPVCMEARNGFAEGSVLSLGDQRAPVVRVGGELTASFLIAEAVEAVAVLTTPPLVRPCDHLPSSDDRLLGLAILSA